MSSNSKDINRRKFASFEGETGKRGDRTAEYRRWEVLVNTELRIRNSIHQLRITFGGWSLKLYLDANKSKQEHRYTLILIDE